LLNGAAPLVRLSLVSAPARPLGESNSRSA
jgi:hypothetical protein